MMNNAKEKTYILVIAGDEYNLEELLAMIGNRPGWEAIAAATDEEAIEKFQQHHFDILLLTGSVKAGEEAKLRKLFLFQHPGLIITRHEGGSHELLFKGIEAALEERKAEARPGIFIVDDALKNAGLDIRME